MFSIVKAQHLYICRFIYILFVQQVFLSILVEIPSKFISIVKIFKKINQNYCEQNYNRFLKQSLIQEIIGLTSEHTLTFKILKFRFYQGVWFTSNTLTTLVVKNYWPKTWKTILAYVKRNVIRSRGDINSFLLLS